VDNEALYTSYIEKTKTNQNKTKQNKTKQTKTKQNKTNQTKPKQNKTTQKIEYKYVCNLHY
jgi:hypothetical protein